MKINHKIVAEHLGVKLRGNETFTELLEIEKQVKEYNERKERIDEEKANILTGEVATICNKVAPSLANC